MAFAVSSSLKSFTGLQTSDGNRFFTANPRISTSLVLPRHSISTSVITFSRRRNSSSSNKKNKESSVIEERNEEEEGEELDDNAFEKLFNMLEEDLKNDKSFDDDDDDDDDDISEEDFEKLQRHLEAALGITHDDDDDDDDDVDVDVDVDVDDDDEEEEEDEKPVKVKNWQMRRLACALKKGKRKTSIKSLAAELCLDRAIVLDLLRDPPPNLVMMSAALPDEPEPAPVMIQPPKPPIDLLVPVDDDAKSGTAKKVPVHVMRQSWTAKKRLKKAHVQTLERIYARTKRPTNAMISSIIQVTNLPWKRVVKWFEDKRKEDGVPEHRVPYQRSGTESVSSG